MKGEGGRGSPDSHFSLHTSHFPLHPSPFHKMEIRMPRPYRDLTGQHFGQWTPLSRIGRSNGHTCWHCRCWCGATRTITLASLTYAMPRCWACRPKRTSADVHEQQRLRAFQQQIATYTPVAIALMGRWVPVTTIPPTCRTVGDFVAYALRKERTNKRKI